MKMPSVMSHNFSQVPQANIQRSKFRRPSTYKTTFDSGYLVPVFIDEVLPGDTFNLNMAGFGRMSTPMVPVMDNIYMDTFFFFVPNRLIWDNWQKFCGEQKNPGDSTDYLTPVVTTPVGGYDVGTLYDYIGFPTEVEIEDLSNLWARAYNLIYNEWFRDENLIDSVTVDTGDGPDDPTDYVLLKRGKRHDYFTSCLPWPQKGDAVSLPLGTKADVWTDAASGQNISIYDNTIGSVVSMGASTTYVTATVTGGSAANQMYADLSSATAATINELREAFQIQRLLERDARGGTRYIEIIKSHFGVSSPDARLQRPEYLGGGTNRINFSAVPQTSSTDATTPQGNLAAFATVGFTRNGFSKSFTEHGVVIGLVSVRADLTYQQGIDRMFSRSTRYDYYWPALANLGEQAVLSKELYADGTAGDQDVFGYQERWAEYRYKQSKITGKFRSTYATSLDSWHLSQEFASRPVLNSTFINETPPIDRVIAVPTEPQFIFDAFFDLVCARPMPMYSVPGLIDHF